MDDPKPATAAPAAPADDWTVQIADRIESVVGTVRDRTTVPITKIARAVVFGLLALVALVVVLVLVVIAAVRLHVYLPFQPAGRQVWVSYAICSAIFLLAGAFAWGKRTPRRR